MAQSWVVCVCVFLASPFFHQLFLALVSSTYELAPSLMTFLFLRAFQCSHFFPLFDLSESESVRCTTFPISNSIWSKTKHTVTLRLLHPAFDFTFSQISAPFFVYCSSLQLSLITGELECLCNCWCEHTSALATVCLWWSEEWSPQRKEGHHGSE